MDNRYELEPGTYYLGDPSLVFRKKEKGTKFTDLMWEQVYQDKIRFKSISIENIQFYLIRTKHGDGVFDDIGTDSGAIMLINKAMMSDEELFRMPAQERGFKWLVFEHDSWVENQDGILHFENGYRLNTNQ